MRLHAGGELREALSGRFGERRHRFGEVRVVQRAAVVDQGRQHGDAETAAGLAEQGVEAGALQHVATESGTNIRPIAMPRPICGQNKSQNPLCGVQWLMAHTEGRNTATPSPTSGAGPTFHTRIATIGITIAVESVEGRIAMPDCHDVQRITCWVKSGNRKTLP